MPASVDTIAEAKIPASQDIIRHYETATKASRLQLRETCRLNRLHFLDTRNGSFKHT